MSGGEASSGGGRRCSQRLARAGWRAVADPRPRRVREFGGLTLHWRAGEFASRYASSYRTTARLARGADRARRATAAAIRWRCRSRRRAGSGCCSRTGRERATDWPTSSSRTLAFAATPNDFFKALARAGSPRGRFPRGFSGEQPYWTIVGIDGGSEQGLLGEDGAIEIAKGGFSIEPFLLSDGKLVTWADVARRNPWPTATCRFRACAGAMPTPRWTSPRSPRAVPAARNWSRATPAQYQREGSRLHAGPGVAAVPGQSAEPVPEYRRWRQSDSRYRHRRGAALRSTASRGCIPLQAPDSGFVTPFDAGMVERASGRQYFPRCRRASRTTPAWRRARCCTASHLAPGETREIDLVAPLDRRASTTWPSSIRRPREAAVATAVARATRPGVAARAGAGPGAGGHPAHRAGAHADQPRRPAPAAGHALLRARVDPRRRDDLGRPAATRPAPTSPRNSCAGTRRTSSPAARCRAAWTIAAATRCRRTTATASSSTRSPSCIATRGDRALAASDVAARGRRGALHGRSCAWASAPKPIALAKPAFYGLMPASISHEGYSAKPMHSYWDDFWALRGYKDAVADRAVARSRWRRQAHSPRRATSSAPTCTPRCVAATAQHGIDFIPGAAELGDFDATSTTIALAPGGEQERLPRGPVAQHLRALLARVRRAPRRHAQLGGLHALRTAHRRRLRAPGLARTRAAGAAILLRRPPASRLEPVGRGGGARAAQAALPRRPAARLGRVRLRALGARHVRLRRARATRRW